VFPIRLIATQVIGCTLILSDVKNVGFQAGEAMVGDTNMRLEIVEWKTRVVRQVVRQSVPEYVIPEDVPRAVIIKLVVMFLTVG